MVDVSNTCEGVLANNWWRFLRNFPRWLAWPARLRVVKFETWRLSRAEVTNNTLTSGGLIMSGDAEEQGLKWLHWKE